MAEEIDAREERSPGFFESLSPKKENYPLVASIFGKDQAAVEKRLKGKIIGLYTSPSAGEPMTSNRDVTLVAGKGIAGDRYAELTGSYSAFRLSARDPGEREPGRQLTILSADAVDAALAAAGLADSHPPRHSYGDFRRNVVVRGVSAEQLMACQGRELVLGAACRVFVHRHCTPCAYNAKLCGREGQVEAIFDASGVSCEVLVGGQLRISDRLSVAPPSSPGHATERDVGAQAPGYYVRPSERTLEMVAGARAHGEATLAAALAAGDRKGVARAERAYNAVGLRLWPAAAYDAQLRSHRGKLAVAAIAFSAGLAAAVAAIAARFREDLG